MINKNNSNICSGCDTPVGPSGQGRARERQEADYRVLPLDRRHDEVPAHRGQTSAGTLLYRI